MRLTVAATDVPGLSTTLLGQQTIAALERAGADVDTLYVPAKNALAIDTKPMSRQHVICLEEQRLVQIVKKARFSKPLTLTVVWTGNVEEYDLPDLAAYTSVFRTPTYAGIPVRHVHHSEHTKTQFEDFVRKLYLPTIARSIIGQTRLIEYGIDPVFAPGDNDPDVLIAPMNRVKQTSKNIRLHAELTSKYFRVQGVRGRSARCDFYFAPGFGPNDNKLDVDLTCYDWHAQPESRADYIANARKSGLFLSVSNYESFGIYYLELLCSGCVGVFLDKPWVRTLIPKYRYVASAGDLLPLLMHVRENYAEAAAYVRDEVIPYVRSRYDLDRFARGLLETVSEATP